MPNVMPNPDLMPNRKKLMPNLKLWFRLGSWMAASLSKQTPF